MKKSNKEEERRTDTDEVLDLLDAYLASSAVCAAMELGLFWHLDREILSGKKIAGLLMLPIKRCQYWLQYLCKLGLLEQVPNGFSLSAKAQSAILDSYSQETWMLLAKESIEQFPVFQFLSSHFRDQGSLWEAAGLDPPMYVERMSEDPVRARQFTRMLYELHQPLAQEIANLLDMSQINKLMDLGGGSGVVSMTLLRRYLHLSALVVDIPNVCSAGRELAAENSLEDRLIFHPADFTHDELPSGFDMVLECDVGIYNEELFNKVRGSLNPSGRYVIIDQFAPAKGVAPFSRLSWALQSSIRDPDFSYPTSQEIVSMLEKSGYHLVTSHELPRIGSKTAQFTDDMYIINAHV
ncbi:MAG: hypothetical protein JSW54_13745 [Fidelibacterota bacterium]|nr:MAG: hypothetical protein JSW54_13745 [Candidatus Neomarinimicrobiota bacterium]